jgi:hypothetical protein
MKCVIWILVVLALIGGAFFGGYQMGKAKGLSNAMKDRATQTYEAKTITVQNVYSYPTTTAFSLFHWGTWSLLHKETRTTVPIVTQQIVNSTGNDKRRLTGVPSGKPVFHSPR